MKLRAFSGPVGDKYDAQLIRKVYKELRQVRGRAYCRAVIVALICIER